MISYYTIMYAAIRHEIDEKISIGIIVSDGESVKVKFSKEKKKLVRKILHKTLFQNINYATQAIENAAVEFNTKSTDSFASKYNIFSKEHLEYLNIYNNDAIAYSKPIQVDIALSDALLDRLFKDYIDDSAPKEKPIQDKFFFPNYIKTHKEQLSTYYNTKANQFLYPSMIDNLRFPTKVDLAGVNGDFVFVKGVDMNKSWNWVSYDLSNYYMLHEASPKNKLFLVGNEPPKNLKKQHAMWQKAREVFTFITQNETEQIEEYAKMNDVVPLNFSE